MNDDEERDEHERHLRDHLKQAEASLKRQFDTMMSGMMEAMAPMLMGSQLLQDEARAWDQHADSFVRSISMPEGQALPANVVEMAVEHADAMLVARRARFGEKLVEERLRGMLPSGKQLCNEPIIVKGEDTGMRCTRNAGHDGNVHY